MPVGIINTNYPPELLRIYYENAIYAFDNNYTDQYILYEEVLNYIKWTDHTNYDKVLFGDFLTAITPYISTTDIYYDSVAIALLSLSNRLCDEDIDLYNVFFQENVHVFSRTVMNAFLRELDINFSPEPMVLTLDSEENVRSMYNVLLSVWLIVEPSLDLVRDHSFMEGYVSSLWQVIYLTRLANLSINTEEIIDLMANSGYELYYLNGNVIVLHDSTILMQFQVPYGLVSVEEQNSSPSEQTEQTEHIVESQQDSLCTINHYNAASLSDSSHTQEL